MRLGFLLILLILAWPVRGSESDAGPVRMYSFVYGYHPYELEAAAEAGISLNRMLSDVYLRGIYPGLAGRRFEPFLRTVWGVFWTFNCSLWPHEAGHALRAKQAGGDFSIVGFWFPFPVGAMALPASIPKDEGILTSVGGLEINSLMQKKIHLDFYDRGYGQADVLVHSFIQEFYFLMYALLITPIDPDAPKTWTSPRGDPSDAALLVYRWYTGRTPLKADGKVDPILSGYYRESLAAGILCVLMDPMFYRSATAFAADMTRNHGLIKPWLFENGKFSWIWGTRFNLSPLGYEIYLTQYLRIWDRLLAFSLKGGRPFKNNGLGLYCPGILEKGKFLLGGGVDIWDQDRYGFGGAVTSDVRLEFGSGVGLIASAGWKSRGYLLARRLEASFMALAGLRYQY